MSESRGRNKRLLGVTKLVFQPPSGSTSGSPAPSPIEPLFQDADAEHGLRAITQVQVFILRGQGHLVLLVPLLLLLQLLGLLPA